jgi:hypothetical protein
MTGDNRQRVDFGFPAIVTPERNAGACFWRLSRRERLAGTVSRLKPQGIAKVMSDRAKAAKLSHAGQRRTGRSENLAEPRKFRRFLSFNEFLFSLQIHVQLSQIKYKHLLRLLLMFPRSSRAIDRHLS